MSFKGIFQDLLIFCGEFDGFFRIISIEMSTHWDFSGIST